MSYCCIVDDSIVVVDNGSVDVGVGIDIGYVGVVDVVHVVHNRAGVVKILSTSDVVDGVELFILGYQVCDDSEESKENQKVVPPVAPPQHG